MAKLSSPRAPEADIRLVAAFLKEIAGADDATAADAVGLSDEWVRQRRAGVPFERLKGPTRLKLQRFLAPEVPAGQPSKVSERSPSASALPPAPTFVEHVLYTAGRIAELANQIAHAAEKQLAVSEELGRRSQVELGARAPTAHHPPAKPPSKSGRNATPRDGA